MSSKRNEARSNFELQLCSQVPEFQPKFPNFHRSDSPQTASWRRGSACPDLADSPAGEVIESKKSVCPLSHLTKDLVSHLALSHLSQSLNILNLMQLDAT